MIGYVGGHENRESALGCWEPTKEGFAKRRKTGVIPHHDMVNSARKEQSPVAITRHPRSHTARLPYSSRRQTLKSP
jgi:hypothetical protein